METKRTNRHVYGERAFWVKGTEAEMVKEGRLSVILRQGDRSDQHIAPEQWLPLFAPVPVYIITRPGNQAKEIAAEFERDCGITVQVVRRTVTRLKDITDADLHYGIGGAVPVSAHAVMKYLDEELSPGKVHTPDTVMTVYWVEYLEPVAPALD